MKDGGFSYHSMDGESNAEVCNGAVAAGDGGRRGEGATAVAADGG